MQMKTIHFILNGVPREKTIDVRASLTDMSWSISTSLGSTASGEIVRAVTVCSPLTVALTAPPPAAAV